MTLLKAIELYRHQESIKDPQRGKIQTPEGIAKSYQTGYESYQQHPELTTRGLHSSAARTEMALDAFLLGIGGGSKEHLPVLDHVSGLKVTEQRRKDLGDSEAMRYNLQRYDSETREGEQADEIDYYQRLHRAGESIADFFLEEIRNTNPGTRERVVAWMHEPTIAIFLIEFAKQTGIYQGGDNAEAFRQLSGNSSYNTPEGTGYRIEMREENGELCAYLVMKAGKVKLNIPEIKEKEKMRKKTVKKIKKKSDHNGKKRL